MKRSKASWTTAIAASALLAMPVGSWAQAQQPSATPSQTSRPGPGAKMQQGAANEHLRQAEAALNDIPAASLTGTAKTKVAELKRHIAMLNKSASPSPGKTASAPAGAAKWSTDVAAADRILTDLLGAGSTTGATEPAMTGTTGTAKAKPAGKTAAVTLDETAKTKLQEVRTHLTAFAASMSGTSSPNATPSANTPSTDDPSASASAAAAAAPSAPVTPSAAPSSPSEPAASTAAPSASAAVSSGAPSAQAQAAQPAQSVDTESVKRHLTAARDSLSQLTQLPAAAQLTGDSRTQVSQLISNFNELITTKTEWRASYSKVQANLAALVGEGTAAPAAPATGTPGAVGTSGTTGIDPAIRAKLEEFRAHLTEFEKAAGGASAGGASSASAAASSAPAASATPAPTTTPESTPTPAAAASTTSPAEPAPTATAGSTASPSATAGTTGSTASPAAASPSPATASPSPASAEPPSQSPAAQSTGHQGMHGKSSDAMRHIEAIEAILNGTLSATGSSAGSTGTTGSTASKAKTPTATSLDRAQIEQIKTHLSELRKALNK